MKATLVLLLTVLAVCFLDSGCATHPKTISDSQWKLRIGDWLPTGTPINEARRALADNGFRWVGDNSVATATLLQDSREISVVMTFGSGKLISQTTSVTASPGL